MIYRNENNNYKPVINNHKKSRPSFTTPILKTLSTKLNRRNRNNEAVIDNIDKLNINIYYSLIKTASPNQTELYRDRSRRFVSGIVKLVEHMRSEDR